MLVNHQPIRTGPHASWLARLASMLSLLLVLVLAGGSWSQTKPVQEPKAVKGQQAPKKMVKAKAALDVCSATPAPGPDGYVHVKIKPTGHGKKIKVDPDTVCVTPDQMVQWEWDDPNGPAVEWTIYFPSNAPPFANRYYDHKNNKSQKPDAPPDNYVKYKYLVNAKGYDALDPDVIIKGGKE